MNIIKVIDGNNKLKCEIYKMQLNQEKARRYKEEQAKKIEFYRLGFRDSYDSSRENNRDGLFLRNYIGNIEKSTSKYIYEFTELPVSEQKVRCTDLWDSSLPPDYHLYSYQNGIFLGGNEVKHREKFLEQQETFINHFIEEGLSGYKFNSNKNTDLHHRHAYIFLNSYGIGCNFSSYTYTDNVVCLPKETIAMYLLETGRLEEAYYYIDKIDIEEEKKLFATFDFKKSSTFSPKQIEDLLNSGLLNEGTLTRKMALDKYLTNYIK